MTDTAHAAPAIAYRSVTRLDQPVYANCRGVNHSDGGEIVTHDRCGQQVVRREDGKIFTVELSGFYGARKFSCYHGTHECDPALVEARAAEKAAALAGGEIVKGATVEVFKGRKVAKGTVGVVFWMGDRGYGMSVGLRTADGAAHFTALTNVRTA